MLAGADSHDYFCMVTIISSTPLHKVRHFQFWHAILDVTYGALGMCTAEPPMILNPPPTTHSEITDLHAREAAAY